MTSLIKKVSIHKNLFCKHLVKNRVFTNKDSNLETFCSLQNNLSSITEITKQQYLSKTSSKLCDIHISSKTYWFILESFLMSNKVFCIRSTSDENRFITNFRKKARSSHQRCSIKKRVL